MVFSFRRNLCKWLMWALLIRSVMENFYLDNIKLIKVNISCYFCSYSMVMHIWWMQLDISNFNRTIGAIHQEGNHWVSLISINPKIHEINIAVANICMYSIVPYCSNVWWGKCGEFGKLSLICQTKTIQISLFLADLFMITHQPVFGKIFIHPLLPNWWLSPPNFSTIQYIVFQQLTYLSCLHATKL